MRSSAIFVMNASMGSTHPPTDCAFGTHRQEYLWLYLSRTSLEVHPSFRYMRLHLEIHPPTDCAFGTHRQERLWLYLSRTSLEVHPSFRYVVLHLEFIHNIRYECFTQKYSSSYGQCTQHSPSGEFMALLEPYNGNGERINRISRYRLTVFDR